MKKVVFIIIFIVTYIFIGSSVLAKDIVYSLNKYETEKFSLGLPITLDEYNSMENNIAKRLIKANKNE